MDGLLQGALVYANGALEKRDIAFRKGRITKAGPLVPQDGALAVPVMHADNFMLTPGFADVHVHLREPGFSYKESIGSGTRAAAHGGYTAVCAMPNVSPPPDSPEGLAAQLAIIRRDAAVRVYPYGCLTRGQRGDGEPAALEALAPLVVGFSDDGRGVQSESLMRGLMERVARLGGIIAAHCEQNDLLRGGYIHDGAYARAHGHRGISFQSEWTQVERDLRLARETGCRYHVCHVSTKESAALIRRAKAEGADVTCETAPHYLLLCEDDLMEDGRFKMNPPLRSRADRDALVEAALDGTIDMVATDHAPHAPQEKALGLQDSAMGVAGLECAFPVLYTGLVRTGTMPLERLLQMLTDAPRRRFGLPPMDFTPGQAADMALWDLAAQDTIDPAGWLSQGRATPFEGRAVYGRCERTFLEGATVWQR